MIAELFYPKELKQVIADLRAQDDLNEKAVKSLNKYISTCFYRTIFLVALMFIPFIIFNDNTQLSIVMFVALSAILIGAYDSVTRFLKYYATRYIHKNLISAEVTRFVKSNGIGGAAWRIDYKFTYNGKEINSFIERVPNYLFHKKYISGEAIEVYFDPKNPEHNVPNIPTLYSMFKLRKDTSDV